MTKIRKLKEFPGYGASRDGRVWTKKRRGRGADGEHWRVLKAWGGSLTGKYARVNIMTKSGKSKKYYVHRLVFQAFVRDIALDEEINHLDGNPQNNCVDNLEAVTHDRNMKHASETGLLASAEKGTWKLGISPVQIKATQVLSLSGFSISDIAELLRLHPSTVARYRL